MKVTITPNGNGATPFTLAGSEEREAPIGFRINGVRSLQSSEVSRKLDINIFDRKNLRNTIEFSVARNFSTVDDAERFLLDHEDAVPNVGVVEFQVSGSTSNSSRFMAGGVQSISMIEHVGTSVKHSYTLVGGKIRTYRPPR